MKNAHFSRRRFLAAGCLGAVSLLQGVSQQFTPRTLMAVLDDSTRPIAPPAFVPALDTWDTNSITAAWIGHATVLIQFYGLTILTDPALFRRIGAHTALGTLGPKRLVAPALKPSELPEIDLVLLSHAHLDHFDRRTLKALRGKPHAITASGTEDLLVDAPVSSVNALRWGEQLRLETAKGGIEVRAFEVKHWGARWRYDRHRGYNGYIISREGQRLLFGGDTAMAATNFRDLRPHGPFDAAIMPIGAYNPWIHSHCTPEEAVAMANAAGSDYLLPVHFKTFAFGREGSSEPMERLSACIEKQRIGWGEIGQTFRLS